MRHVKPTGTPVVAVLVVVVASLLSACGGGSGKTATPTTVATGPTTTAVDTAALTAKAAAALFQPADWLALPTPGPAFKEQMDGMGACPDSAANCDSLNLETIWSSVMSCLGVTDTPEAKAVSATYLQGQATQARVAVEYTTPASADAIRAAVQGPKYDACMTTAFTTDAKGVSEEVGSTPSASTVSTLSPAPTVPGLVQASRVRVDMNLGGGLIINIYQDFLVVINGGTVIRFFFLNPGGPFLQSLEAPLVMEVTSRAG